MGKRSSGNLKQRWVKNYNLNATHKIIFFQTPEISTSQELKKLKLDINKVLYLNVIN
jgi:hypothetical protein